MADSFKILAKDLLKDLELLAMSRDGPTGKSKRISEILLAGQHRATLLKNRQKKLALLKEQKKLL